MNNSFDVVFYNGKYISPSDVHISLNDRAFRYGDGLFETMHANGRKIQFFQDHISRFRRGVDLLKLILPEQYTDEYIAQCIDGVLHRCRLYQGASVKLSVWRTAEGKYIPNAASFNLLIEASYLSEGPYALNSKGLIIGIYDEIRKPVSPIFSVKSCNSLFYIMAGIYANENNFDDVVLLNNDGGIVEATSSNVFFIAEGKLITPSSKSGCLFGVMRLNILKIAKAIGMEVIEVDKIFPAELISMDEIFMTNANCGIKWIAGFENKRYLNRVSRKIMRALNEKAF